MAETELEEERQLVLKSQNGDRAAFKALMSNTLAKTWSLAWRLTANQTDAEDLTQETYLKAWLNISKFRFKAGFSTWLYRIEFNCFTDGKRKDNKRKEIPLDGIVGNKDKPVMQIADPHPDALTRMETSERISILRKILESLEPDYKQVLILRELEGLSYETIADILKIPQGTVAARLFRAKGAFRKAYLQTTGEKI